MYADRTDTIINLGMAGVFAIVGAPALIGAIVERRWDLLIIFFLCLALAVPLMREGLHELGVDNIIKRGRQWFRRIISGKVKRIV